MAQERYTIIDNGDGTQSVWGRGEQRWITLNGAEDMLPHQARSLRAEYELGA